MKKILKYLIILGILQSNANASSEPPSAASVDISDGLVAHYPSVATQMIKVETIIIWKIVEPPSPPIVSV